MKQGGKNIEPYLILTPAVDGGKDDIECLFDGLFSISASGRENRPELVGSAWVSCVFVARNPASGEAVVRSR